MADNGDGSEPRVVNRRAFLVAAGGAGAAFIAACGGAEAASASRTPTSATRPATGTSSSTTTAASSTTTQSDAEALRGALRGHVLAPGRPGYADAARVYNL